MAPQTKHTLDEVTEAGHLLLYTPTNRHLLGVGTFEQNVVAILGALGRCREPERGRSRSDEGFGVHGKKRHRQVRRIRRSGEYPSGQTGN